MEDRIKAALGKSIVLAGATRDLSQTFHSIGFRWSKAEQLTSEILDLLSRCERGIQTEEQNIFGSLCEQQIGGIPFNKVLEQKLAGRAEIIYGQVSPYFKNIRHGHFLDYGYGDGRVAQLVSDRLSRLIVWGCDRKIYPAKGVTVPIVSMFPDDSSTELSRASIDAGMITNVIHHEKKNQDILNELARVFKPGARLVVIETVPVDGTLEAFELTFFNDFVYNRLFHQADIPVPGTYETFEGWVPRFQAVGFELDTELDDVELPFRENMTDLGFDQETIRDRHVRYVFRRTES